MSEELTHIYLNPVAADRADEFERFLRDVVEPAVHEHRPHLDGRWRTLRAAAPGDGERGVVTYAFVMNGGDISEWDLDVLLREKYGDDEAARLVGEWAATFFPFREWIESLTDADDDSGQLGWSFAEVMP